VTVFVDTNVLVYARDATAGDRQERARRWLEHLWRTRTGRLSNQVLHEYYAVVTRKLRPGLAPPEARSDVRTLHAWRPLAIDAPVLEGAWQIEDRFGLSFWDALIVSAARVSGCDRLLTEDLQDGQEFGELVVWDPFAHEPPSEGIPS
jgi:predicted nucleic acid-binding protein